MTYLCIELYNYQVMMCIDKIIMFTIKDIKGTLPEARETTLQ